jgi:hypothetical protein
LLAKLVVLGGGKFMRSLVASRSCRISFARAAHGVVPVHRELWGSRTALLPVSSADLAFCSS